MLSETGVLYQALRPATFFPSLLILVTERRSDSRKNFGIRLRLLEEKPAAVGVLC